MNKFKDGFLWGNSTSSMQTEGAYNLGGKGKSVYDVRPATENTSDWNDAIDTYHRYAEDDSLMADLGMNCYRFEISWSRVQPTGEGEFNSEGIAYYDKLVDDLLSKGIEPMVCLYHFDIPLALAEKYNGFVDKHVVDAFFTYSKKMVEHFANRVKYWITFNEQNLYGFGPAFVASGYLTGEETLKELYQIQHNVALAHAKVANFIHANYPDIQIGGMLAYQEAYPASPNPEDVAAARKFSEFANGNLLSIFTHGKYSREVVSFMKNNHFDDILLDTDLAELSQTTSDFISFSYYATSTIDSTKIPTGTAPNYYGEVGAKKNPYLQANEWSWQIDPLGFRTALTSMSNLTGLPIFPIENGIGVREKWDGQNEINDQYRIDYHRSHIQAMKDAITEDGVDVIGYLGWGLIDIPSSKGDMEKRYGVVYVNRSNHDLKDMKRVPKASYHWLKRVIKTNGSEL